MGASVFHVSKYRARRDGVGSNPIGAFPIRSNLYPLYSIFKVLFLRYYVHLPMQCVGSISRFVVHVIHFIVVNYTNVVANHHGEHVRGDAQVQQYFFRKYPVPRGEYVLFCRYVRVQL